MSGDPDDGNGTSVPVRVALIGAAATVVAALIAVLPTLIPKDDPEPVPKPVDTTHTRTDLPPTPPPIGAVDQQSGFTQVGARPLSLAGRGGKIWVADPTRPDAWWLNATASPMTHQTRLPYVARNVKGPIRPVGVAVAKDAAWFVDERHDLLWRIDAKTNVSEQPSPVGRRPVGVAVDGNVVWVASRLPGEVWRIDASSGERMGAPIGLSRGAPRAIAARGGVAWVVGSIGQRGAVWRIDGDSEPDRTNSLGDAHIVAVAAAADGVWTADVRGTVSKIDPAENVVERRFRLYARPCGIAVDNDAVWVTDFDGDQVWRLDPHDARRIGRPIRVEAQPCAVTLQAGAVWVGNLGDNSISRVTP